MTGHKELGSRLSVHAGFLVAVWTGLVILLLWGTGVSAGLGEKAFTVFACALIVLAGIFLLKGVLAAGKLFMAFSIAGFFLSAGDIVSRPFLQKKLYYRTHERFACRRPETPVLGRYQPNVRFTGEVYGDLAAMSGDVSLREERTVQFVTDGRGFRNDPVTSLAGADVIVLADSIGVGEGTTQPEIWINVLARAHGIGVYNLSFPGNPWQHFMNLQIEAGNIQLKKNAKVLLMVYPANDLENYYGESADVMLIERKGWLWQLLVKLDTFRRRSPVRQILEDVGRKLPERENVMIRDLSHGSSMAFYKPYIARTAWIKREEFIAHPSYGRLLNTINGLKTYRDLDLRVAIVPSKEEIYSWIINEKQPWTEPPQVSALAELLGGFCATNGIRCYDMKSDFLDEAKKEYQKTGAFLWWRDDTHWNTGGNEVAARLLFDNLIAEMFPGKNERMPSKSD